MPMNDYQCPECNTITKDVMVKQCNMSTHEEICPECQSLMGWCPMGSKGRFDLKGTGWAGSGYTHIGDIGK